MTEGRSSRCTHASAAATRVGVCPRCLLEGELPPALLGDSLELLEEIGRGGMGSVWKARHRRLDRIVAVKFLTAELSRDTELSPASAAVTAGVGAQLSELMRRLGDESDVAGVTFSTYLA